MTHQWFIALSFITLMASSSLTHAGWLDDLKNLVGVEENDGEQGNTGGLPVLTDLDINKAFKQALEMGSERVVSQLSQRGGFNNDKAIHIPLPNKLEKARGLMDKVGMAGTLDDLEIKLNEAAERATPQARQLFIEAIKEMTFDDVRAIYNGPEDSATRYFEDKMTPKLSKAMAPVVSESLSEVGAIQRYDSMITEYKKIPMVPDIKADLTKHVVSGGLKGIFHYLAQQEAEIRANPARHTTDLLKDVFGVN